jgi:hypothetical protein
MVIGEEEVQGHEWQGRAGAWRGWAGGSETRNSPFLTT